jgi:hypothetical protein
MTTRETTALITSRDEMIELINAEILEYTGTPYKFGYTENVFFIGGRVWHEFKILDDTQLLMYAFLDDKGGVHTVNELDEARNFEFPEM